MTGGKTAGAPILFRSTRGRAPTVPFAEALQAGLAPDGGLYVPQEFPNVAQADVFGLNRMAEFATLLLRPFVRGGPLESRLAEICDRAFDFPIPLRFINETSHGSAPSSAHETTAVLELFHGPTAAFKDVGARFLAQAMTALNSASDRTQTVLVATSGDTGGAVAGAFYGLPDTEVIILFPKGRISPRQEKQLTAWGGNIRAFAVDGTFDDCQRMVKEAFQSAEWQSKKTLVSANSINIGRLFPQAAYYALASTLYRRARGEAPGFIIPSGNLGNAMGALWARTMGFPIREVFMALNANRPVADFLSSGDWNPTTTVATLANAMDVGHPSNFERLRDLYPDLTALTQVVRAQSFSDEEIRRTIQAGGERWGEVWCPHTATAVAARETLDSPHWVIVATAHPAKFESVVEPLIGREVPVPQNLQTLLGRPSQLTSIGPHLRELARELDLESDFR